MAHAIADDVFEDIHSAEQLSHITAQLEHQGSLTRKIALKMKKDKENMPVHRSLVLPDGSVHPSAMMKANRIIELVKDLGERFGYQGAISPYSFRRGFANTIDS
jgi:hypothetical protein